MSSNNNLPYRQAANVKRRTWDRDAYEAKAKQQRQEGQQQLSSLTLLSSSAATTTASAAAPSSTSALLPLKRGRTKEAVTTITRADNNNNNNNNNNNDDDKEEFRPAAPSAVKAHNSKRALLQARQHRVTDIDAKIGTIELVSAEQVATSKSAVSHDDTVTTSKDGVFKTGVGWHCRVCDCYLKDSHTYLDHINGRKHQRKLGYSMRVERSTKEQVDHTLQELVVAKQQQQQQQAAAAEKARTEQHGDIYTSIGSNNLSSLADRIKAKDAEAQQRREEKRARRRQRHEAPLLPPSLPQIEPDAQQHFVQEKLIVVRNDDDADEGEEEEVEQGDDIDPAMAAMLGFSGFGGSKRNR